MNAEVIIMNGPMGKYAWTVKVGEKGQIVIPKEAREAFGISSGDTMLIFGDVSCGLVITKLDVLNKTADEIIEKIKNNQ